MPTSAGQRTKHTIARALLAAAAMAALPATAHAGTASVFISKNAEILSYRDGFGVGEANDVTVRFANGDVVIDGWQRQGPLPGAAPRRRGRRRRQRRDLRRSAPTRQRGPDRARPLRGPGRRLRHHQLRRGGPRRVRRCGRLGRQCRRRRSARRQGGHRHETFITNFRDGADDYHGGPGRDFLSYHERIQPLNITLDNVDNDGESGELDNVRSNVEDVTGGHAGDTISSLGAFSSLDGGPRRGADILDGGPGPDTLTGRDGADNLIGGSGNDVIFARDDLPDNVDRGSETDTADRDTRENRVTGCENGRVGVLRLAQSPDRGHARRWRRSEAQLASP
jgi:hypothetical protein